MVRMTTSIKDTHAEKRLFLGRVVLAVVLCTLLLGIVVNQLYRLQIVQHDQYSARAQGNRIRTQPVSPIRGLVLDRNGRVLAENLPAFQLELIPEQVDDLDATLEALAELELIDAASIDDLKQASRERQRFRPVTLNPRLSDEDIARFAINRPRFPGVDFIPRLVRTYPYGKAAAHVVGYVSALTTDDLQTLDEARYAGTRQAGRTGIEAAYETDLHGYSGFQHVVTNARGRQIASEPGPVTGALPDDRKPDPGDNLVLTIDIELQRRAAELMADKRGAIVAMDPTNGEVLALVSAPAFDPNLFARGMSSDEFRTLTGDPDRPLFNRAVLGTYPPGSTIKPIIALAALESGATNLTRKSMCRGFYTLPNNPHRYRDWKPEGHGEIDLHSAIEQSCDVYFYEFSNELGIDKMHEYLNRFGLGRPSGIDLIGERSGLVPSTQWKQAVYRDRWYQGETVIASIGQGYMLATPLQLASAVSTIAMRGDRYQPRLVASWIDPITGETRQTAPTLLDNVGIDNEFYWDDVIGAMNGVMQSVRGTAYPYVGLDNPPYRMAGKSGTAQVISIAQEEEYNEEEIAERLRDHALFVSFAPLEAPTIAVAVVIENGSSGSRVAAPIARELMDLHLGYADATE